MGDTEHDDVLASNLEDLYELGNRHIPALADEFGAAATTLKGMSNVEDLGCRDVYDPYDTANGPTPDDYYADGGGLATADSPAMRAWIEVRDLFAKILGNTEQNLRDVGGAVILGVREIVEQDTDVARRLGERTKDSWPEDLLATEDEGRVENPEEFIVETEESQ